MEHTKLLSIVKDILNEGKNVWRQPPRGKYKNEAHAKREIKKMPSKLQKFFTIKSIDGPSYGVEVEATDEFHKKSDTIDSNIDYFTYELEGFEIGLIDGHYPEYISIFNKSEWM